MSVPPCLASDIVSHDDTTVSTDSYIILAGLSGLLVLLPYGNISAIDAYFFGVSASTETGLNTYVVMLCLGPRLMSADD